MTPQSELGDDTPDAAIKDGRWEALARIIEREESSAQTSRK
jgi:hypothetical protein